jgi:hypothetical protein
MAELLKQLGAQKGGGKNMYDIDGNLGSDPDGVTPEKYIYPSKEAAEAAKTAGSTGGRRRRNSKHHKGNSWLAHVKATMKDKKNKGKSFKQVLKLAKKTYKKSQSHSLSSSHSGGNKRKFAHSNPQSGGSGNASASTFGSTAGAYPN